MNFLGNLQYLPFDVKELFSLKRHVTKAICNTVACLHSHNYAHGDIHPSNILVMPNGMIKLCDVGFSSYRHQAETSMFTQFGRGRNVGQLGERYQPPEVIRNPKPQGATRSADIFSLGWTIHSIFMTNQWEDESEKTNYPYPQLSQKPGCPIYVNQKSPTFPEKIQKKLSFKAFTTMYVNV